MPFYDHCYNNGLLVLYKVSCTVAMDRVKASSFKSDENRE